MKKIALFIVLLFSVFHYSQTGNSFHDTKGNIEVNSGGQVSFTLPIPLPPGVKDVAPQINLNYISGSGNGVAGYGWNIGGITGISRVSKNIEKDNEVRGIQNDLTDLYTFNGQRLILKSGVYGQDGAEYVTEKYSNLKIKSYGSITGKPWSGPLYWEVNFEDGSQAWYGSLPNLPGASTDLQYNIVKWKDVKGNYISYEYDQDKITNDNVTLIKTIKWGGNENINKPHFNTINFDYIDRSQKETAYHQGILHVQRSILKSVTVLTNQQQFKKFVIDYLDIGTSYQFLNKITEYNSENETANPITVLYTANQTGSEETSYSYNITNFNTRKYGDFNLDGIADFIEFVSPGVINFRHSVYANTGTVSLQYDSSKFSANDFKNAVPVTFKKNNYVPNKGGLVIPVPKATSVAFKKDYEFRVYSVNLQNNTLEFEYSKTIEYDSYTPLPFLDDELDFCNTPSIVLREAVSYDFNGDGISELLMKFQSSRICGSGGLDPGTGFGTVSRTPSGDLPNLEPVELTDPEGSYTYTPAPGTDSSNTEYGYIEQQPEPENILPGQTFKIDYSYVLVDLDQNIPVPQSVYNFEMGTGAGNSLKFADFNGDGIQEVIIQTNSTFSKVLNIKRDLALNYSTNSVGNFAGQNFVGTVYTGMLFGDFNGDSKTDILVPQANKSYNWDLYVSNGKNFIKSYINNFIFYQAEADVLTNNIHNTFYESGCSYGLVRMFQYQTSDIDADGKSDILVSNVLFQDHEWNAHRDQEWTNVSVAVYSTNKLTGAINQSIVYNPTFSPFPGVNIPQTFNVDNSSPIQTNSDINFFRTKYWLKSYAEKVIPFSTLTLNRTNQQIILTGKPTDCQGAECDQNYVLHYNYTFLPRLSRIGQIQQGGVTTNIEYREIWTLPDSSFYKPVQTEPYPFIELEKVPLSSVVSQLTQFFPNGFLTQDFRYRGILSNFHGRGIIGFRQFAKSSWYASGYSNTKIWSGTEFNPLNESVPIKEWTIKTEDENKIFPANLSETNTELLSYKSYTYQVDKLLNGQIVSTVADADKPNIVTASVIKSSRLKDFLTGTLTTDAVDYGEYYLPSQTVTNVNNNYGIYTTNHEYDNNPSGVGADYHIGRLKTETSSIQAYNDTKTGKEEFTYESNLLKTSKKWNRDNTGYVQETFSYDGFGNVTKKIVSNNIDSQTTTLQNEYDSKGRFVTKKTDNLGLETNLTYNNWGQVLTQTDPLNNTVTTAYDGWGKILNVTSNLSGTTSYTYEKLSSNAGIKVKEITSDGNENTTYTNVIGQKYKLTTKAFGQGKYVSVETKYDPIGRKISDSEPYYEGQSATQWNTMAYDDTFFPAKVTATSFKGKKTETSVSGFTTTIKELNGYSRITSKTVDALGNVITSTDPGGAIQFNYNAASEQIKATYGANIVTTKFDLWGRKSEFEDPSNGKYKYEYDGLGKLKKVTSPKGNKQYVYNNLGQLITQTENSSDGVSTNKSISLAYDGFGRNTSITGTANGKPYSSTIEYDTYGRLKSKVEESNGKTYTQNTFVYDDKSRIKSYKKSLLSSGVNTSVNIENTYHSWNGELYQVKDKTSNSILWELQDTNAKGQELQSKLGAATITNAYDSNGFLTSINHSSVVKPNILQISYSFDAIKNELTSRTTGGDFNILENFTYDNNNRLINWTNPRTGTNSGNTYDTKGRITINDQVGKIKYEYSGKIYQPSSIDLNQAGVGNYANDVVQQIYYNENNDPIYIDGVKGDVAFQYGLTSMRQRVTYGGNFNTNQDGKFTKFYNEDGTMEITRDNLTGLEKHILYVGGSPYESSIIYVKNYSEASGSYKFLHKDYLGSILAVSDEAGNKLEQRHFDAWGNFTHLQLANGAIITDKALITEMSLTSNLLLDRGYTGHEHFMEVGIIHMNGRLYDPLLRRFLNADENIQDPYNTQNYNKYGYVMNNPLLFNDPSGEYIFGITEGFVAAIVIGAMVGTASYILNTIITGQKFTLLGYFKAEFFGALSGAVTYGIGSVFTTTAGAATQFAASIGKVGSAFLQAAAHGVAQGTLSLMQGADLSAAGMAAITGFVTSGVMSGLTEIAPSVTKSLGASMTIGGVVGGVTSELAGGNFWQGAVVGAVVAGLNHTFHQMGDDPTKKKQEIVKNAKKNNGSTDWAYEERNGRYGPGTNKCNVFVDDMLDASGVYTTDPNGRTAEYGFGSAVTAGQWADPNYDIPGWKVVQSPQAGDVVAIRGNFSDASGHVAIMISPTKSIGAGHSEVHVTEFGSSPRYFSDFPGNNGYVYRRYVGLPSPVKPVQINTNNYYRQYP